MKRLGPRFLQPVLALFGLFSLATACAMDVRRDVCWVVGMVKRPARYSLPLGRTWTLAEALRVAGGGGQDPKGIDRPCLRRVRVDRIVDGEKKTFFVDARPGSQDAEGFVVLAGDVIAVPTVFGINPADFR